MVLATSSYSPLYATIEGKYCIATNEKSEYFIRVVGGPAEVTGGNYSFTAKLIGPPVGQAKVVPTNGKSATGIFRVNVTAPPNPQNMILRVNVTSASPDGVSVETVTKEFVIEVLTPVIISATVRNEGNMTVKDIPFAIYADGSRIYETTISLDPKASKTIMYNWTDPNLQPGVHVITVVIDPGNELVNLETGGTSYTTTIYIGKSDYTIANITLAAAFIISLIAIYIVYRRPKRRRMKQR